MSKNYALSQDIVFSDKFLSLTKDAQLLYFHLVVNSDNGLLFNANAICRAVNIINDFALDELKKQELIYIDNGIMKIVHWSSTATCIKMEKIRGQRNGK